MRVILFRGKREDGQGWIFGSLWDDCGIIRILSPANVVGYSVIPETVGQYTGLMDKNGKRIFEGDCLDHPLNTVEYLDDGFCVAGDRPLALMAKHSEVIGNIHDNLELVGGAV